jgi:UDP-3-O-[3-hydroxymyristoyl] glucosamine N-acyltransferase
VAHGVSVGPRTLFAAQVGIAGSTVVEEDVVLAGQVGVAGHIRIGKGVVATAQTGVPNSIEAGELVSGYPAIANRDWLKASAVFRQLPALKKRVATLEQCIIELEEKLAACRIPSDRS